ncbi:cupin domain-containing protein [Mangrovivirga cuniculi]|uniref:Cupin domain-containing protein n=1 Tax=Mangrovivirga cuniculi TaxID=2715131 RepID=A0A4D7JP34_9BACT|nr:cupin domain-containing protein [Mangrovivirga cuniculi]QCK16417.1 cupin domain-containing protein [Mangrovivirga cuniculi]
MKNSKEFLFGKEIEWEEMAPGVKRQILGYDDKILMARVIFEKGGVGSLHKHHHSQATYVVSGKFELQVENEKKILSEGDGFYIPPNAMHGAVCLEEGELIDVFSPIREDFFTN